MTISLIVAYDNETRAIGKENKLLFDIPDDLKRFKELTTGSAVIMGRETFLSIGKPLPNRLNVVLSKNKFYLDSLEMKYDNSILITATSLEEAIKKTRLQKQSIFIIGGASIYKQAIQSKIVDNYYLTLIMGKPEIVNNTALKNLPIEELVKITEYDESISAEYYLPELDLSISKKPNVKYVSTVKEADSFFEELDLSKYDLKFLENKYHNGLHYINVNFSKK
jgi:dihydrofolate reductase